MKSIKGCPSACVGEHEGPVGQQSSQLLRKVGCEAMDSEDKLELTRTI